MNVSVRARAVVVLLLLLGGALVGVLSTQQPECQQAKELEQVDQIFLQRKARR